MIITAENDPIGQAISNYYFNKNNTPIQVLSSNVEDEELPPDYFFRKFPDMPKLERLALKKCEGKVLDIGAGAGCHSLFLQSKKVDVTALEISQLCCNVMNELGVKKIENTDILSYNSQTFDTILLLMNGIGIAGNLTGLKKLLNHFKTLLNSGGKILLDSSDLIYLFEQEDGSFKLDINSKQYYGEVDYQLNYNIIKGKSFSWLFADHVILSEIAEQNGFEAKILEYGPHFDYLAELKLVQK